MGDTTRIGTACSSADKQNVHESNCSPSQPKMHASIKLISLLLSITFPASALGTFEPSQKSVHQVVVPSESPLHRVEKPTENVPIHMVTQKLPSLEYSTYGGNEPHYRRLAANEALVCWAETHLKVNSTMSLYLGVFLTVAGTLFMTAGNILMKLGSEMEGKTQSTWLGKDIQWIYGMLGKHNMRKLFLLSKHKCLLISRSLAVSRLIISSASSLTAPCMHGVSKTQDCCVFSVQCWCILACGGPRVGACKCTISNELLGPDRQCYSFNGRQFALF